MHFVSKGYSFSHEMSAMNNERSGRRDDNNEINNANSVVGDADEDIGRRLDENLPVEDAGHYTDDPERVEASKPVDVPPDGGYGWVCVACVFLINGHTWGVNSVSQIAFYNMLLYANNSASHMESFSLTTSRVTLSLAQLHLNMHLLEVYRFL